MSEATIDSSVQETIDILQQGSAEMLGSLQNPNITHEALIEEYGKYVDIVLKHTDVQTMFDALARIAGLVGSKSPRDSEEINAIIVDRGMLMNVKNPEVSWEIRMGVSRLLGRFATTTAALLPDYMNNSQIALLETPHVSIAEQP